MFYVFNLLLFFIFVDLFLFFWFPYFRGNSLNSRAGIEFKEFRLFLHDYFSNNRLTFNVFFWKIQMGFAFSTMIFRKKKLNFN